MVLSFYLYHFEVVYTMIMIPYNTLPVEMTKDFNQRTYLTGSKAMFGKVANFLAAAIPGIYFTSSIKIQPPHFPDRFNLCYYYDHFINNALFQQLGTSN